MLLSALLCYWHNDHTVAAAVPALGATCLTCEPQSAPLCTQFTGKPAALFSLSQHESASVNDVSNAVSNRCCLWSFTAQPNALRSTVLLDFTYTVQCIAYHDPHGVPLCHVPYSIFSVSLSQNTFLFDSEVQPNVASISVAHLSPVRTHAAALSSFFPLTIFHSPLLPSLLLPPASNH